MKLVHTRHPVSALTLTCLLLASALPVQAASLDDYNVVWDTPSADSAGSMPLGNGEIALNAWVEPSGDLLFYIARPMPGAAASTARIMAPTA